MLVQVKDDLQSTLSHCLKEVYPALESSFPVLLDIPSDKKHGEFSANAALKLSGVLKQNPMTIAESIRQKFLSRIADGPLKEKIKSVEVKKPGFLNFYLTDQALYEILREAHEKDVNFGRSTSGKGQKVQIEFVSANPTGPLSVAHARQAAVGDALVNIFAYLGYDAKREFYVNDEGNQINILGDTVRVRAYNELIAGTGPKEELAEHHYQGEYIIDIAKQFIQDEGVKTVDDLNKKAGQGVIARYAADYLLDVIKKELEDFGVHFDVWSRQSRIATNEKIASVLKELEAKGYIYSKDGALWFKSTAFGDDKDRVVKKSDGSYTYLAPDIVYHKDKFERGFKKVINIWGPDHHGYIPRIKAAAQALGQDADRLEVLIVQLATIYREGKPVSMSTRRGQYISLREVMEEVGVDAARFFFLMRHLEVHLDFDLELAKKETPENPVYYIQYAHARINSVLKVAQETNLRPDFVHLELLKENEELDLIREIGYFPDILALCVRQRDPFALVSYLQDLAACFHKFYDSHRVVTENLSLSCGRLALIDAARIVFFCGLKLLGVSAPQKM